MHLGRSLSCALGLAAAATLTTGALAPAAGAATPPDLHHTSFANRSIPGSTCFSGTPIQLRDGHGDGGYGYVVNIAAPRYGDITGDGRDEAFVLANCGTGGGTASSDVKNSFVVFTGTTSGVKVLGVIAAAHNWRGAQTPLLEFRGVRDGIATVREYLYSSADASCCPTFRARSTYVVRDGKVARRSTRLPVTDKLVLATGIGRARLGQTPAQLRAAYPNTFARIRTTASCTVYRVGSVTDPGDATRRHITAFVRDGRVVQLVPASDYSATVKGAAAYLTPELLAQDYPGRVVQRPHAALVRLDHSWLRFGLATFSGLTLTTTPPSVYAARPGSSSISC